jgi:hypothetical protein
MADVVAFKRKGRGASALTEVSVTAADGSSKTLKPDGGVVTTDDPAIIGALDMDGAWRRATTSESPGSTSSQAAATTKGGS